MYVLDKFNFLQLLLISLYLGDTFALVLDVMDAIGINGIKSFFSCN